MNQTTTYQQIGELFFKTGLAEVFDIQKNEDLLSASNEKAALLCGFLRDAVEGNLTDPLNIRIWEKKGKTFIA